MIKVPCFKVKCLKIVSDAENNDFLSHEDELQLRMDDEMERQQQYHALYRSYDIPEINIDTHPEYHINVRIQYVITYVLLSKE